MYLKTHFYLIVIFMNKELYNAWFSNCLKHYVVALQAPIPTFPPSQNRKNTKLLLEILMSRVRLRVASFYVPFVSRFTLKPTDKRKT